MKSRLLIIFTVGILGFAVIVHADNSPVPEPQQDRPIYENCGPGTTRQDGICVVTKDDQNTESSKWGTYQDITSPLKQIQSGVPINEIQCKDGLVQVFKKTDNSPACVSFETKAKLMQRGWAESSGNIVKQRTVQSEHSPRLISKPLATFYAAEQMELTEEDLKEYDSHATLLKIKNDGFAFEVDPNTLEERELYMNRFNEYPDGQYIWLVSMVKNNEYQYHINATDGKILLSAQDGAVLAEPEPGPIPDSESLQQQKKQLAKISIQETILADTRGTENKINAIKEYRDEFETGFFLEQFIHTNKQNYEKDKLMNFIYGEWGFQSTENTSPTVTVYFRSYDNYDKIEKINEWKKPKDSAFFVSPDSDGYLIMDLQGMPPAAGMHETCIIPGEYRVSVSNPDDESKVEWGYFTCQKDKLVGESQPWMELPE